MFDNVGSHVFGRRIVLRNRNVSFDCASPCRLFKYLSPQVFSCWDGGEEHRRAGSCLQLHHRRRREYLFRFAIKAFKLLQLFISLLAGACYAEFGVRVPHTSGSAYMYSYVSVGEFVAFVIGWNMILEYLIGTSACACALSASFDSLLGGSISSSINDTFGTVFGRPPDFIAFIITLLMTCVLACGASKSVMFNNVLNTVNLATWIFIMTAGLFYVDTSNWSEHDGFLPYGWSGVFTGAATCFYAFIGFDIIATTGEEAHNPQKSIPKAIVGSLIIVLIAYVSTRFVEIFTIGCADCIIFYSSFILTLVVPYDHIDTGSALLQMWSYVGAPKCRAIVAIGATAGLSVAMFGSMFPMPRVRHQKSFKVY